MRYRLENCHNKHQGNFKKVLCVCSAGMMRSPTAALVLSKAPFNFNTRAAGVDPDNALIVVDAVLVEWADEIVCMELDQQYTLEGMTNKPIICLGIPDLYNYRDTKLMKIIKRNYIIKGPKDAPSMPAKVPPLF